MKSRVPSTWFLRKTKIFLLPGEWEVWGERHPKSREFDLLLGGLGNLKVSSSTSLYIWYGEFLISGNFYFSLVSTSLAYITIPKKKGKINITPDKKLTTTFIWPSVCQCSFVSEWLVWQGIQKLLSNNQLADTWGQNCPLKTLEMTLRGIKIAKFSGGACPQAPLTARSPLWPSHKLLVI